MSLYRDGEIWYISFTHNRRRIRETTGTADKDAAQEFHDKRKAELWREAKLGERHITFGDACSTWLKDGVRGKTDRYGIRHLLQSIAPGSPLRGINGELVDEVLSEKSPSTKRRYINLVSAICRLSGHDPKLKRPAVKEGRIRWLTKTEWKNLQVALSTTAPHLLPLARMAIYTGLRASNILNLEWSQCDLTRSILWVHADQSKSGKPISVPLSPDAMKLLRAQAKAKQGDGRYVFPYYETGEPIGRVSNHGWKAARKDAGLEDIVFHDLRRTWASWHAMNGTPLEVLQKLGGWADYKMVLVYAHLATSHLSGYAGNAKPK